MFNKPRRPLTMSVMSHPIGIEWVEVIHVDEDQEPNLGVLDVDASTIAIATGQSEAMQRETLMHEVLHLVMSKAGINAEMTGEDSERIVKRLAPVMLDVLVRNGHLVDYLRNGGAL